jgi:hypothetical protein
MTNDVPMPAANRLAGVRRPRGLPENESTSAQLIARSILQEAFFPFAVAVSATATNVPTFSFQILRYDLFINRFDPLQAKRRLLDKKENIFDRAQNIPLEIASEADMS